jgi:hypothetical protein
MWSVINISTTSLVISGMLMLILKFIAPVILLNLFKSVLLLSAKSI